MLPNQDAQKNTLTTMGVRRPCFRPDAANDSFYHAAINAAKTRTYRAAVTAGHAQQLRQEAGKLTGSVRFEVDGYLVVADLPKRTEYDQLKLKEAVEALRKWGEDPEHYVAIEIKVAESKYTAWPPGIRQLFEPARTLKTGKPSYKLEQIKSGDMPEAANDSHFGEVQ